MYALSFREETFRFLKWMQSRLYEHCLNDLPSGLYVDQKWLDLAPSFFPGFGLIRDDTANVAYWNLHERPIEFKDGSFHTSGKPIKFFHFSGYRPENIRLTLKTNYDLDLGAEPDLHLLLEVYKSLLLDNGYLDTRGMPFHSRRESRGMHESREN